MTSPGDPRTVAELVGRADEGWSWFRAAAVALGADEWQDEVPGGGWTRHKMLNHIRVWHELTAQRIGAFRETGERPPPPGDDDAINAQAAADADLRSRELIERELDASYARLRDEIGLLRDDQLAAHDDWPIRVVEANTWGHYEDHRRDVTLD